MRRQRWSTGSVTNNVKQALRWRSRLVGVLPHPPPFALQGLARILVPLFSGSPVLPGSESTLGSGAADVVKEKPA